MKRYEALAKRIVDAINAEHGATFVGKFHPEGSYSVAVTVANALADDHEGAVSECERLRVFERAFAKVPQEQQARIMDAVRADAAAEGQYAAKEDTSQSRWVVGGCYEENRLRLIEGRALDVHEQLTLVEASE